MDTGQILELFDRQMRRDFAGPVEVIGRTSLVDFDGWAAVLWSDLDERTADAEIAQTVARLRRLCGHAEWKLYGHDRPADLAQRLAAAGLQPGEEEAVLVADVAQLSQAAGADVRVADDPNGVSAFMEVQERVFDERYEGLERELRRALDEDPPSMLAVVAFVEGRPVSSGRIQFAARSDFAGLFGGATAPEWRGRGLYRATVAKRAELARARGYRYLYVDALPTSRPILERLGFVPITTTIPFTPGPAASSWG